MKRLKPPMAPKRALLNKCPEPRKSLDIPEVALAAVVSYKKQKEVCDFINFILSALERNSDWLNSVVDRQNDFKCALMVGAGPNRFHLQEIIYPSGENDIKLEVEMKDSEDHDKIAIAAMLRLTNSELDSLVKYMKTRMMENYPLRQDLLKGKALGVSFAILRPMSEKQYRIMERIVIGSSMKCVVPAMKKRHKDEPKLNGPPAKRPKTKCEVNSH